ncbi:MAG: hypothetical protein U0746_03590 [Gemmataceae bacterium]
MGTITLTDELRAHLPLADDVTQLQDVNGKTVAVVLSKDEYLRLLYDLERAIAATPEAEAERQKSLDEIRQGKVLTSAQLFEKLRQHGYMPRTAP